MKNKDTLYARMLSNDLSRLEIKDLKASGEWEEIKSIVQLMDEVELPPLDKEKGLEALKVAIPEHRGKVRKLNSWWRISAAASILILVGILVFQQFNKTTISAELASTESYQFSDNSTVTLNDGSEISFDKSNWDKKREVKLVGEAFFQVEKGNPFIVDTGIGSIEVLGTSFNIKSWDGNLFVVCYSGSVKVTSSGQEFILSKGQKVNFLEGNEGIKKQHKDAVPSWINAVSTFYGEDLNSVFDEIERQYNIEIVSPNFDKKFTGTFTHDSFNQALYQVCTPMGITFNIDSVKSKVTIIKN